MKHKTWAASIQVRAVTLAVILGGCALIGKPETWGLQQLRVSAYYDTVARGSASDDHRLLTVRFDTVRNRAGYPMLYAAVTATNLGGDALVAYSGFPSCHWMFSAFDNAEREGAPLRSEESLDRPCRAGGLRVNIAPGDALEFPRKWLPFDSIAATRGPGEYFFGARLRGSTGDDASPVRWLTDRLPAGSVVLVP